ncbi:hypothetical protein PIB30_030267 [Stylosanthes scabra]|uniref:Uncharacterized protein n=1 Tax=Stylosanthes scabra TaxID=79078 RepID=A0ABU6YA61_9FABA|nr:hypothetical protein [Stylosanthes scabra]
MFAPPDLPVSATHPRDELTMPEDTPARGRRNDAGGRGRRPPANAAPPRPLANSRYRRRREMMGVRIDIDEAQEEAEEIGRREDEGDVGDQTHVFPARPQWLFVHDAGYTCISGYSPQPFPVASPDPFLQCTFDVSGLDDVFDMIRVPDTVVMS